MVGEVYELQWHELRNPLKWVEAPNLGNFRQNGARIPVQKGAF